MSDSCDIDIKLCRIVSDLSTLLNVPSSPKLDTERLFPLSGESVPSRTRWCVCCCVSPCMLHSGDLLCTGPSICVTAALVYMFPYHCVYGAARLT